MRSAKYIIVEAKVTHKEKEGSIILQTRFENQNKALQFFPVVAVPDKYKGIIEVGDTACVHFNVVVFDSRNGVNLKGKYFVKDSMYIVPDDMLHFVIKKDGEIVFFEDNCIIEQGKIGRDEITTAAGIILPDVRAKIEKKHDLMEGVVYAKSAHMHDVEIGDKVRLADHSDYEIEFPDGEIRWFVQYKDVLYKYE